MRKRNRGSALLLALLLTLGGAWPAYAAEPETPPPAATEESGLPEGGLPAPEPEEPPQPAPMISAVVTGFAGDGLPALPAVTLPVRQTGNSDDDLELLYRLAVQHQSVTALVTEGEENRQEPLGVAWDFGDIDQTKTGTYQAVGRIELPEGYVLAEGVPGALYIPVTVEDQSPEVITAVESWYPYTDAFALPLGSDLEVLEEKFCFSPYTLQCETESGKTVTAAIEWDFSGVEFQTVGVYLAVGTVLLPENTVFGDGFVLPQITVPVSVQQQGRPELNCLLAARGALVFPWVAPPGDLAAVRVWLSEDGGPWEEITDGAYWDETQLSLFTDLLNTGCHYRIQADYDGGQTGILSFLYADEIVLEGYHDGDRDGGDTGGNPPQDIVQPPADTGDDRTDAAPEPWEPEEDDPPRRPEPPEEDPEVSKPEPSQERVTETESLLSGARVLTMAQVRPVRFSKQGVTLTLSDAALDVLSLRADSVFYIELFPTEDGFSLTVEVDGRGISDLPDCEVMLPVTLEQDGAVLVLTGEDGTAAAGTLDAERGIAVFPIRHTGRYTLSEMLTQQPETEPVQDALPAAQSEEPVTAEEEAGASVPAQTKPCAVSTQPSDPSEQTAGEPAALSDSPEPELPEQAPASQEPKELSEPFLPKRATVLSAALVLPGGAVLVGLGALLWRRWRR